MTPVNKRLVTLAAGALLLADRSAKRKVAAAVKQHADKAAADAEKQRDGERKAALLLILLHRSKAMAADVRQAILEARREARETARARLNAELKAAGVVLSAHEWVVGSRSDEDAVHAESSATSLASQWRGIALAAVLLARRKETSEAEALETTHAAMQSRIDRTASTEVAQAYADEHRHALVDVVDFDKRYRDGGLAERIEAKIVREWCAMLDACERCWPHDGEQVGIHESYDGGDEPGYMHARCRCYEIVTSASAESEMAA